MAPRRSGVARRMDAAIDHFGQMGYRKADVCSVVNKLLKVGSVFSPTPFPVYDFINRFGSGC